MTYCVAALASSGIVFASDSRTSAGTDEIASYSKMTLLETPGERVIALLSAGSLATSQSVITLLQRRRAAFMAKPTLYDAAAAVGETVREVMARDVAALEKADIPAGFSFIIGGEVRGETPRLFQVYEQGNFIEATRDTCFLQLGETRYAKALLQSAVGYDTDLRAAAKCLLLAVEATRREDVAVGAPIDLLVYEKDRFDVALRRRFEEAHAYLTQLSGVWARGLAELAPRAPEVAWH
jgi:putative proteasome-type protease